jgi:hypothetical protein
MADIIKIKRSTGNAAPASLAAGELAYSQGTGGTANGGALFYGEVGGNVVKIGGKADADKLAGIEAGAQVNAVTTVAGRTGAVVIDTGDLAGFSAAVDARIGAANLDALNDVVITTVGNGQTLAWNSTTSRWENVAPGTGVTDFVALNDTPGSYSAAGGFFVKVNAGATALEFVSGIDGGTY